MQKLKVLISAGGTGGHIFPAIAVANSLKSEHNNVDILFVGAKDRMEMEKVPQAGYKIEGLWISGLQRRLTLQNLLFPVKLLSSMIKARKIYNDFKPNVVAGFGGFASGPMIQVALKNGTPGVIQEQNSYPGITNKMLAKRATKICVAYAGMEKFFPKEKIMLTGNPVRQDILKLDGKKAKGIEFFGLDETRPVLLVIGGSLGAKTINESVSGCAQMLVAAGIQVVWQTGKSYVSIAHENHPKAKEEGLRINEFIQKMDLAYAVADVVVSRAGAMSVSELCLTAKPSILVPSPNVAEDHQTKNAMALVNQHAAILVKDSEAKEKLGNEIISLIGNEELKQKLSSNISDMAYRDSAKIIANEIVKLAK